ncbi:ATP synthase epsilon chain [Nonlabens tegetincola]|uniref:ATP synthase epsilon chain n=1 Tax=Nonlabens tegetincola TaxID=323273 RepID=A0A090PY54_9FLAO|nr:MULTISPECIES: F0F1 ATP synthase subunit epsilon [Nonlabens]MEE2801480.1 F0F1 ATP synthase subunit epsilon [Bacteroidota bacterium]ALM20971.1 ATP synthase subunit delta [Nonlabens sp. MIC269]ARN72305.1 hypothetical protein BST91_11850 [Nonlabens tegetincola]PQJ20077.1 hypothetical protein BST93_01145 [Nonlabens tegetincola]GAK95784.1 ATP synthase epsilon chain [Nonlabens tegetincola]
MKLEIVTPELTVFSGEVESVAVPGVNGEFQMLDNHAPVVSLLVEGDVRIYGSVTLNEDQQKLFVSNDGTTNYKISGGVIEMKDNKAVVLAD